MSVDVPTKVPADPAAGPDALARWRTAVAGVLAKSAHRDPGELGAEPERSLDTPTYDGFAVRALYTALDELGEPPLPGEWPYVRGGDATRDVNAGWKVAEAFPGPGAGADGGNAAVLAALTDGVSALLIRVGESGVAPAQLGGLLAGVHLDLAPVILDAGADYPGACDAVLALVDRLEPGATPSVDLGADPLGASLGGRASCTVEQVVAVAARVAGAAACGRSPSTGRPSIIWAPARRGSWPARWPPRWPTCGSSSTRESPSGTRCARSVFAWPPTTTSS